MFKADESILICGSGAYDLCYCITYYLLLVNAGCWKVVDISFVLLISYLSLYKIQFIIMKYIYIYFSV